MIEAHVLVLQVFADIDKMDARAFAAHFTDNGVFRFANLPAVEGREAVFAFVKDFFSAIAGIRHSGLEHWQVNNYIFVNGTVGYTRHDGNVLEVPFSVTWVLGADAIEEYRVFVDSSALFS